MARRGLRGIERAAAPMKGWHKHGVCALRLWKDNDLEADAGLHRARAPTPCSVRSAPISASTTATWSPCMRRSARSACSTRRRRCMRAGRTCRQGDTGHRLSSEGTIGGHAFAIVGYDDSGFWIQNSWGPDWGSGGLARVSYDDWLANGTDVWVAGSGVPVHLLRRAADGAACAPARRAATRAISTGRPAPAHRHRRQRRHPARRKGAYGLTPEGVQRTSSEHMPARHGARWKKKRVLLYAHGGLVTSQASAIQRVANNLRRGAADAEVYPLSLHLAHRCLDHDRQHPQRRHRPPPRRRRARHGQGLHARPARRHARAAGARPRRQGAVGRDEGECRPRCTTKASGAARLLAGPPGRRPEGRRDRRDPSRRPQRRRRSSSPRSPNLVSLGVKIKSLSLWAPACTLELFDEVYLPLIEAGEDRALRPLHPRRRDRARRRLRRTSTTSRCSTWSAPPSRPGLISACAPACRCSGCNATPGPSPRPSGTASRHWHLAPGPTSHALHHGDFDNDEQTLLAPCDASPAPRSAPRWRRLRPASRRVVRIPPPFPPEARRRAGALDTHALRNDRRREGAVGLNYALKQ